MRLNVNGEARSTPDGISVADLLRDLELAPVRVAVEVNRELVRRADFDNTKLREEDRLEIVTFVGGG